MIPLPVSAHRDLTQFKDPDRFNPSNFLDDHGEFQNNDAFMPFAPGLTRGREPEWQALGDWQEVLAHPTPAPTSTGKRMCLGAGLACSEIFLFLTAILHKFSLLPVGSPTSINLTPQYTGLGNVPPAFQLHLVAR